jgi:molecular chaperone HscB
MWKKQIGERIPTIARRLFSSHLSLQSFDTFQCSKTLSHLCGFKGEESRVFKTSDSHAFQSFVFSGKNFYSAFSKKGCCWNCDAAAETSPFLVCESCRTVQPVDHSADYFQIFGWEKSYKIPNENLEGKYKDWQKKLHPDLVHSKSEREKTYAAEQSGRVIDAYRTLSNPLSRAIYLMRLEGVEVDEEQTVSEPELLDEIMEIREAVEEASDAQTLKNIQAQIEEKLKQWSKSFGDAFQRQQYEEAHVCIQRMTYYQRVIEEIVKKL